jgi:uncharacterized protein (DUF4415 family)
MNDGITGKTSMSEPATDWNRLSSLGDDELRAAIDADPDAPATDEAFWRNAKVAWPRAKESITIRLDADLLTWLRQERGYRTRINAILRSYMKAHTGKAAL